MNPIEKIKNGINNNDWQLVCEAYNQLTGESISTPHVNNDVLTRENIEKTIMHLLHVYDNYHGYKTPSNIENKKTKNKKKNDQIIEEHKTPVPLIKKTTFGNIINEVHDPDLSTEELEKIKSQQKPKRKRTYRPRHELYKVKCSECKSVFDSIVSESEIGQKCKDCIKSLRNA